MIIVYVTGALAASSGLAGWAAVELGSGSRAWPGLTALSCVAFSVVLAMQGMWMAAAVVAVVAECNARWWWGDRGWRRGRRRGC